MPSPPNANVHGELMSQVKGRTKYLYRAVDSKGNTLDFLLAKRDAAAAKRFFSQRR